MKKLVAPNMNYNDVFEICVNRMHQPRQSNLRTSKPTLDSNNIAYESKAISGCLYEIPQHNSITDQIGKNDMVYLYEERLLDVGRVYYDTLLSSSPHNTCPFCLQRKVKTLDHYLPKSLYPSFSITPYNLVPCCSDCNSDKDTSNPSLAHEQFIHPYFDDLGEVVWLQADVIERTPNGVNSTPVAFVFSVVDLSSIDPILHKRICNQFTTLNLGDLYASHAVEEFGNIRGCLAILQSTSGWSGIKDYLQLQLNGYRTSNPNSWNTAMYQALLNSSWFQNVDLNY